MAKELKVELHLTEGEARLLLQRVEYSLGHMPEKKSERMNPIYSRLRSLKSKLLDALNTYKQRQDAAQRKRALSKEGQERAAEIAADPAYQLAEEIGGDLPDGAFWALYGELGGDTDG